MAKTAMVQRAFRSRRRGTLPCGTARRSRNQTCLPTSPMTTTPFPPLPWGEGRRQEFLHFRTSRSKIVLRCRDKGLRPLLCGTAWPFRGRCSYCFFCRGCASDAVLSTISRDNPSVRVNYIHQNPVRAGWVERAEDYRRSSVRCWKRWPRDDEPLVPDLGQIVWRKPR